MKESANYVEHRHRVSHLIAGHPRHAQGQLPLHRPRHCHHLSDRRRAVARVYKESIQFTMFDQQDILLSERRLRIILVLVKAKRILGTCTLFARESGGRWRRNNVGRLHTPFVSLRSIMWNSMYLRCLCCLSRCFRRSKQIFGLLAKYTLDSKCFSILRCAQSYLMTLNILHLAQGSSCTPGAAC